MKDGFQLAIHGDETFQEIFKNSFFIRAPPVATFEHGARFRRFMISCLGPLK